MYYRMAKMTALDCVAMCILINAHTETHTYKHTHTHTHIPTPEEVARDPTVRQNKTYLGHETPRQAYLPIREGGL